MKIRLTTILIFNLIKYKENSLIICLCNAISDKVINKAILDGANTVWQVYQACDCKPQCGSCSDYIKNEINSLSNKKFNN